MDLTPARFLPPTIAIACGGTGGHLFPGMAVGRALQARGCEVSLLVSDKDVDQAAVAGARGLSVVRLPAVGLAAGSRGRFLKGFFQSLRRCREHFQNHPPHGVLAMGGFTSAPPILAGWLQGAWLFLHESNTLPGRANRWLAQLVDEGYVGFPQAAARLRLGSVAVTGTPVRSQFQIQSAAHCRRSLGLEEDLPVLLVMGGSQGARGLNDLVLDALPVLVRKHPSLQYLLLTGAADADRVQRACQGLGCRHVVHSFYLEMQEAMSAATVAVSRAGASSLAEIAALQLPSLLVPFPTATDNHQFHNATAFQQTGAARLVEQGLANGALLAQAVMDLLDDLPARETMARALAAWHTPRVAEQIADRMLTRMSLQTVCPVPEVPSTEPAMPILQSAA